MSDFSAAGNAILQLADGPDHRQARRILHGRGGNWPGLEWCNIDAFWPLVLVTVYQPLPAGFAESLITAFIDMNTRDTCSNQPFTHLAIQQRYLQDAPVRFLVGEPLAEAYALRGEQRFLLQFDRQNCGFFVDIEPARQWLEQVAPGKKILNLFAFTCSFSVVASVADAQRVVNVDMSRQAIARGRTNHRLNGISGDRVDFMVLDILKSWGRIRKAGLYDVVIIDPPSYQKGSFIAQRDYGKIIRRIPSLAQSGAQILACLNAPELDQEFLLEQFHKHCPDCIFEQALIPDPAFESTGTRQALKMLVFSYKPGAQGMQTAMQASQGNAALLQEAHCSLSKTQ